MKAFSPINNANHFHTCIAGHFTKVFKTDLMTMLVGIFGKTKSRPKATFN